MKEQILQNLHNPTALEKLYRENKSSFSREFNAVYPDISDNPVAQAWHNRINFEKEEISWGNYNDIIFVIVASLIAGLIARIPFFTEMREDYFYSRNIGFIVFPFLTAFFAWKHHMQPAAIIIAAITFIVSVIYINYLPYNDTSDTTVLACMHLPLMLWSVTGFAFAGGRFNNYQGRIDFLRYNGDLIIMTGLMLLAGAALTGVTLGLFSLIGLSIENFYFQNVAIWGLAAAPILGTYLVRTNPHLVSKISPVIAKVFTPLVLLTLVVYLIAIMYTGKNPYTDREFLVIFNLLLIGVMAIILFSVAQHSNRSESKLVSLLLFSLSAVTIIVNGIALSAILFRISEWGVTPNRLAVLGGNILILTNLLIVSYQLFRYVRGNNDTANVERSIAAFLPVYVLWTIIVVFVFPLVFNFE